MKKHLLNFVKAVCFLVVLSLVLSLASKYITPKNNTAEEGMYDPKTHSFISEPKNSFEVLFIGNSDARCGFSPNELWHNYGITSFVIGQNSQTAGMMYTAFEQFIKTQKPKVVVLETDVFFATPEYSKRVEKDLCAVVEALFPVALNHDVWKQYTFKELITPANYTDHYFGKGQGLYVEIKPDKKGERIKNEKEFVRPDVALFTDLLLSRCKSLGIEVMFVELPTTTSWNMARHLATKEFADKRGIKFWDMQVNMKELGFDLMVDSKDYGNHLNYDGAIKATALIGDYLHKNYNELVDYRSDPAYDSWNDDYETYIKTAARMKKKYEEKQKAEEEKAKKDKAAKDKANKDSSSKKDGGKK